MMDFVLDNSVSMRWLLESEKSSAQKYVEAVLNSLVEAYPLVQNLCDQRSVPANTNP